MIDLGVDLDNSAPVLLDEIVNPNELEVLARQTHDSQEIDEDTDEIINPYEQSDTDEEPDDACYDEEDY
jgi:hypothetical protein